MVRESDRQRGEPILGLYDLKKDVSEQRNLLKSKPQIAARLKQKLEAWERAVTPANQRFTKPKPAQAGATSQLANVAGRIVSVSATAVTVKPDDGAPAVTFKIAPTSSLKSVVDTKLPELKNGAMVKVDGKLSPDRSSIAARSGPRGCDVYRIGGRSVARQVFRAFGCARRSR